MENARCCASVLQIRDDAVMNILTAIFVDNTVVMAQPDRNEMLIKQRQKDNLEAHSTSLNVL